MAMQLNCIAIGTLAISSYRSANHVVSRSTSQNIESLQNGDSDWIATHRSDSD
jgi:hypothetical protein